MKFKTAQETVDTWIRDYGVRYFNELTNMVILTEEVGELARLIARKFGEQSFKTGIEDREATKMITEELADILFVVICLANQMDIDLTDAFQKSLEKKTSRDQDRHKQNPKLQK